ncbi:hypothetical protein CERSUDRAFT_126849 [Gelatoporia subvermispora B]|uniref:MYND-type domain-containing protein n=1 Tax=Ceriporiopsis subvermispora (strain B) TaxID=914234 RepID=M2QK30_CERS8|nr:hypothetical protein CERSUDRAFT_126849 [Gelatoporia subvermispora B]
MASMFLRTMPSPENERVCVKAAAASLKVLGGDFSDEALVPARTIYPTALDTCVTFITQPRTTEEIQRLSDSAKASHNHCNCDMRVPVVARAHRIAASNPTQRAHRDPFWGLMVVIICVLSSSVPSEESSMRRLIRSNREATRLGRPYTWPETLEAVLPYGPETSFKMVLTWLDVIDQPRFLKLIHSLSILSGIHLSRTIVIASSKTWSTFARIVRRVVDEWTANLQDPNAAVYAIVDLHDCALFLNILWAVDYNELRGLGTSNARSLASACNHVFEAVFARESLVPPHPTLQSNFSAVQTTFFIFTVTFLSLLDLTTEPLSEYNPVIITETSTMFDSPIRSIHTSLAVLGFDGVCGARGCEALTLQTGRKFARCSGCGLVPYCSKECQKRAWKDAQAPHRFICAKMQKLSRVALRGHKLVEYSNEEFEQACRREGVEGTVAQEICDYLRKIISPTGASGA